VRVSNAQIQKVLELHLHKCRNTGRLPSCTAKAHCDQLVLSPRAATIQQVKEKAFTLPELRKDVVQDVKHRLESGDYKPDPDVLAARLLGRHSDLEGDPK